MTLFQQAILKIVRMIPPGKVMSYGQVAAAIGAPRAARQVGWGMHSIGPAADFPWWRVLNNQGRITIKGDMNAAQLQKELLEAEGVVVSSSYQLDMKRYRFLPSEHQLLEARVDPGYLKRSVERQE